MRPAEASALRSFRISRFQDTQDGFDPADDFGFKPGLLIVAPGKLLRGDTVLRVKRRFIALKNRLGAIFLGYDRIIGACAPQDVHEAQLSFWAMHLGWFL
mgnify:CR=1 FL=1